MSFTDPADLAQPDDGQGEGGEQGGGSPYADYLSRIPEEVRGDVEPIFKEWDASVTKRFQDASEYRKSWEPYESAGLNQYDPEYLQQAAQFAEVAEQNPAAIQEWFQGYAQQHGLQAAVDAAEQFQQDDQYDGGYQDPGQQQELERLLEEKLGPLSKGFEEMSAWRQEQEFEARKQQYEQVLDGQLEELHAKHKDTFDQFPGIDDLIETFAAQHVSTRPDDWQNAVSSAWTHVEGLINQISKSTLQSKVDAPASAEGGGVPDANPERITDMKEANQEARRLLQQWNRQ